MRPHSAAGSSSVDPITPGDTGRTRTLVLLYAVTIFLSAFLLFQVQPMIGKYILPWFGSTPGVWATPLFFFQMVLLGGYAYVHFGL